MTAPQITVEGIQDKIKSAEYTVLSDGRTTICQITLQNGYTVIGKSACVSSENFNRALGEKIAFEDASNKIWELEGYLLKEKLYLGSDKSGVPGRPVDFIARVCHEVNRAYCQALGDNSQSPWEEAPEWQKISARNGVVLHTLGDYGPEASHISWMKQKIEEGWKYGPEKDAAKKEHPCMVPFDQLSREQQAKDFIFRAVVYALRG